MFDTYQVYIGHHYDSAYRSPNSTSPPVSKIIIHKNFNEVNVKKEMGKVYDLALLELSEDVDLKTFSPACLARSSDLTTFDNKMALATGKTPSPCSFTYLEDDSFISDF